MAPFFLLVVVFLLMVWRFFGPDVFAGNSVSCPEGMQVYNVVKGDTCWDIAEHEGCSVEELKGWNDGLECDKLRPGMELCLSVSTGSG